MWENIKMVLTSSTLHIAILYVAVIVLYTVVFEIQFYRSFVQYFAA